MCIRDRFLGEPSLYEVTPLCAGVPADKAGDAAELESMIGSVSYTHLFVPVAPVSKEVLSGLIKTAEGLDAQLYTKDSYQALTEALNAAKACLLYTSICV